MKTRIKKVTFNNGGEEHIAQYRKSLLFGQWEDLIESDIKDVVAQIDFTLDVKNKEPKGSEAYAKRLIDVFLDSEAICKERDFGKKVSKVEFFKYP